MNKRHEFASKRVFNELRDLSLEFAHFKTQEFTEDDLNTIKALFTLGIGKFMEIMDRTIEEDNFPPSNLPQNDIQLIGVIKECFILKRISPEELEDLEGNSEGREL